MKAYAHPEVLVDTEWVKTHLDAADVRIVEIDVDTQAYDAGHIPGAVGFNWQTQLQDQLTRDIISRSQFESLVGGAGIGRHHTVVIYGDNNNWFAAYGFWLFSLYGHPDVRLMNGGRQRWLDDPTTVMTTEPPTINPVPYSVENMRPELRALLPDVLDGTRGQRNLVDVRSVDEFTGKVIAPPGMTETAQRGGHIPGAVNIPWSSAVNADGTFKPMDELRALYVDAKGIDPHKDTIAYCRIGERSSHTWFVLKYLLGIETVRNYDGSWTEYGNLVGAPIEK